MITFEQSGSFKNTDSFFERMLKGDLYSRLDGLAREGQAALAAATPVDSGLTAKSWQYEIAKARGTCTITWSNTHVVSGAPIAILLQYGHGTGTGGYVAGRDYINPSIKPIFEKIADNVWKAVTSA